MYWFIVLVDILAFVMVLFQRGVFEYILVYRGRAGGGLLWVSAKPIVYADSTSSGGWEKSCEGRLGISTFPNTAVVKYG